MITDTKTTRVRFSTRFDSTTIPPPSLRLSGFNLHGLPQPLSTNDIDGEVPPMRAVLITNDPIRRHIQDKGEQPTSLGSEFVHSTTSFGDKNTPTAPVLQLQITPRVQSNEV